MYYSTGPTIPTGLLLFIIFALIVTLVLVIWDAISGWGWIRKAYPGEECFNDGECLDGLKCVNSMCACP